MAIFRLSKAIKLRKDAIEYYQAKFGDDVQEESVGPNASTDIAGKDRVSAILMESKKMSLKQVDELNESDSSNNTSSSKEDTQTESVIEK